MIEHRMQALEERIVELESFADRQRLALDGTFTFGGETVPIRVGDAWPRRGLHVAMRFEAKVPDDWSGPVRVRLRCGGEALLRIDGQARFGLNRYHDEVLLTDDAHGEVFTIDVDAVPRDLLGTPTKTPHLDEAALILPDLVVREMYVTAAATLSAARTLAARAHPAAPELLDALERALIAMELPRGPTDAYLARLATLTPAPDVEAGAIHSRAAHQIQTLWEETKFEATPLALDAECHARIDAAHGALRFELDRLVQRYPTEGRVNLVGHSHIDVAWLWPIDETRRKARRTFATAVELLDQHPGFRFAQSSAVFYAWVEEDDPALFARVRAHVEAGRWAIVGGSWVEPDGNITSGESTVRQFLYGQRYFASRFGRTANIGWLPDTFGYAANLPQLFAGAGMPYFTTTKLHWNETNPFPNDVYRWEGLDGTSVVAHTYKNLNADILDPRHADDAWRGFRQKALADRTMMTFGWGDGGGGPTEPMVETFARHRRCAALPELTMDPPEVAFTGLDASELPVWRGEKYLEFHRGTFTAQERLKRLVRRLDRRVVEAEITAALAWRDRDREYPRDAIDDAWRTLLVNEFHDILPGSCIATVAREAETELAAALETSTRLRDEALGALVGGEGSERLVVFNLSLEDRPLVVEVPDAPGVQGQATDSGVLVVSDASVPGLGFAVVDSVTAPPPVRGDGTTLDNGRLRIEVADDGTFALFDLEHDREVFTDRGNQIFAYEDLPRAYEAWEIDERYEEGGRELVATEPPVVTESGPLRASVCVVRRARDGVITQHYRLVAGARRVDIETHITWNGRRTMLRAKVPVAVHATDATFETPFGAVTRPVHTNTSWDRAKFEVPAMRWADLSEHGYGVSLLNDGLHGYAARGGTLSLTLMRTPIYPDPTAGDGEHRFTYAVHPHAGPWQDSTLREADALDAPLVAHVMKTGATTTRWLSIDTPHLRLAALKKAEEGDALVLRLYEGTGARGTARLADTRVRPTDLLEQPTGEATEAFTYTPWRVLTFRTD